MVARWGEDGGKGELKVWDGHVHPTIFKMDNQPRSTTQHIGSMLCGSLDGRGVWGKMDTCICMAEFLCCAPESTTTQLIGYLKVKVLSLSCVRLCEPVALQAPLSMEFFRPRILEWVAIPFSRGSS